MAAVPNENWGIKQLNRGGGRFKNKGQVLCVLYVQLLPKTDLNRSLCWTQEQHHDLMSLTDSCASQVTFRFQYITTVNSMCVTPDRCHIYKLGMGDDTMIHTWRWWILPVIIYFVLGCKSLRSELDFGFSIIAMEFLDLSCNVCVNYTVNKRQNIGFI